jgi:hypothetical protein
MEFKRAEEEVSTKIYSGVVNATNGQRAVENIYLDTAPRVLLLKPMSLLSNIDGNDNIVRAMYTSSTEKAELSLRYGGYKSSIDEYDDLIYDNISDADKNRPSLIATKRTKKRFRFIFYLLHFFSVLIINGLATLLLLNTWKSDNCFICYPF